MNKLVVPPGGTVTITMPGGGTIALAGRPKPDPKPDPRPDPKPDPSGIEPPAAAEAAGLTRLIFHADFSDPAQLSRTTRLTPGAKFCLMGPGNPKWGASELPSSAIRHEDGTIEIVPNNNNFQGDIITSDSEENGFFLRGNRWYVEARIKHADVGSSKGTGFFAFWSMDAKHWYTNGPRGRSFLEPDFYEYIGRRFIHALHHHKAGDMNDQKMHMISTPPPVNVEEFFVAGAMAMPDEYSWYVNGEKRGAKSPPWYGEMADYKGPIIIGSGPQMPYTIDWVRAWGPA